MSNTYRKLRNCSAHVNVNNNGFCPSYELVSYSTPVALLGMIDGEFVDDNGECHTCEGMALLLSEDYDCSITTMSHVRKFIEDYIGTSVCITDIRAALKSDNVLCNIYGGTVMVYRCSW